MATLSNTNYFSPTQIAGCSLWLDAADANSITQSGGAVSQWNDKSGNGRNMFQPTTANQPNLIQNATNNLNGVRFIGANSTYMNISNTFNVNGLSNVSIFIVATPNSGASTGYQNSIIWWNETGGWGQVGVSIGTTGLYWRFGTGQNNIYPGTSSSLAANRFFVCSVTKQSLVETPYINGTQGTIFNAANAVLSNNANITYVGQGGNTTYATNTICEILFYSANISSDQRQQIEGYLAWKWGLQANLPNTHPYFYNPMIPNLILPAPLANPLTTTNTTLIAMNPTQIAGCALWLDAADSTSVIRTGVNVTAWNDKSGNGYSVTGASGSQPTYTSDTISFNGSQFFTTNYTNSPAAESIFMIVNVSVTTGEGNFLHPNQVGGRQLYVNTNILVTARSGIVNSLVAGTIPLNNRTLIETTNSGTSLNHFINGLNVGSNNSVVAYSGSGSTIIGSRVNGSSGITGSIHEIVIFNTSLTTTQRQQIEGYLAWKWGLQASLPNTHPYFYNPLIPNLILPSQIYTLVPSFSPVRFSGLGLWLDAADTASVVRSGSSVTQWNDKSGNGKNFTTTSGSPTYTSASQGVFFNGTTLDIMTSSSSLTYTAAVTSLFIVVKVTGTNNGFDYIFVFGGNSSDNSLRYNGGGAYNPNDIFYLSSWYLNGATGGGLLPTSIFNASTLIDGIINNTNTSVLQISTTFNGRYLTGYVQEVILYNSAITLQQRQQIEGYLAWKWGLQTSLPATHPYFFAPPS